MNNLGERLKEIRKSKGFPQKTVASFLNMQRANYSKVENNNQKLTAEQLALFCEFFNVSADYILNIRVNDKKTISKTTVNDILERIEYIKGAITD